MKTLKLMLSRLKQYYRNNKFIFVLFVIGGLLNAIVFAYFYGNQVSYNADRYSQENYYRKYTVYLESSTEKESYKKLLESDLIQNVIVGHPLPSQPPEFLLGTMNENINVVKVKGTLSFSDKYQVIVSRKCRTPVGDSINFYGKDFTVIGQNTNDDEYYIPYEAYEELGLEDSILYVYSKKHQDISNDKVAALIKDTFPDSSIDTPAKWDALNMRSMKSEIILICVCYAFSTISFMFLLRHMLDSMVYDSAVCMIVGASKSTISAITFWESMLLSLTSGAVGLVLHRLLYNVLFKKINITSEMVYKFSDYIFIFLLMFCITVIVTLPFIGKYTRLTPVSIKREQEN